MLTKMKLLAAVGLITLSASAWAAPTVYTGFQQVNSVAAIYSITTDGSFGDLDEQSITDFSVTLSYRTSSYTITPVNGYAVGSLSADAEKLFTESTTGLLFRSDVPVDGGFDSYFVRFVIAVTATGLVDGTEQVAENINANNYISFANAVPVAGTVPEPATWLTMVLGMGAVGFAMRCRKTSKRVSYAA